MSTRATMIDPERQMLGEVEMVGQDRWEEIHRRAGAGASIRAIARELDVDRKTVRRCLRQTEWKPYQRAARADTLLATHAAYLRRRPGLAARCSCGPSGSMRPSSTTRRRWAGVRTTAGSTRGWGWRSGSCGGAALRRAVALDPASSHLRSLLHGLLRWLGNDEEDEE